MKKLIRQILIEETEDDINKTIRGIKKLLSLIKWDGLCDIWVDYNPLDKEYEIRSKYVSEDFNIDEVQNELEYLDKTLSSMGVRAYIFTPFFVDSCEDEVKFMNESKGNKKSNYLNLIKKLVEPFKDEEGVCDIRVVYNEEDDMYDVFAVTSTEKLREKFFYVDSIQQYLFKLRTNIKKTITNYLPIKNLYVGSYGKPNCEWKPINESKEIDKVKIAKKIIQTMFDNVTYIEQKKYENKPLLKVYFERISNAANEDSWMTHQICDKIDEYTSGYIIAAPSWGPEWSKRKKRADLYIDASEGGAVEFDNPF